MRRLRVLVATLVCLRAAPALASGLGIPDLGTGAMAQGAANVAAPDDLSALYYNPAALVGATGLRVMLDARVVQHRLRFQRLDEYGENAGDWQPVENAGGAKTAPIFGLAYRLKREGMPLAFAIGGHPATGYSGYRFPDPVAIRATYPKGITYSQQTERESAQRYALISNDSLSYTFSVGLAARVREWLDVGFTLQNPYVRFRSRQSINAPRAVHGETLGWDAVLDIDATDAATVTGSIGATARLPHGVHLGASVQLPANLTARGTMKVTLGEVLATGARVEGERIELNVKLPYVARFGARLVREWWEAEAAFTWDGWSRYGAVELVPQDIRFVLGEDEPPKPMPKFTLVKGMKDAQSVRLGGLVRAGRFVKALDRLTIRAGALAETSAVPDERLSLDQAHWERLAASVGAGVLLGGYELSLAWSHFFQPVKQIRNSAVRQPTVKQPVEEAPIVGNGDYESQLDLFGVSLTGTFGR